MQVSKVGTPWDVIPGTLFEDVVFDDTQFIFYDETAFVNGAEWPPSITTYHGHPVPFPNVKIEYLGRGRRHWNVLVTFKRRSFDAELGILVERDSVAVPGWQGDNNTIHLTSPLAGEDDITLDMSQLAENPEDIDNDYLARYNMLMPGSLSDTSAEVFFEA